MPSKPKRKWTKPAHDYHPPADTGAAYMPTQEEIRLEAAKIREGWSETRWQHQSGYQIPVEIVEFNETAVRPHRKSMKNE